MKRLLFIAVALLSLNASAADKKQTREQSPDKPNRPNMSKTIERIRVSAVAATETLLLDSMVSVSLDGTYSYKSEYEYDGKGNQTLEIGFYWDSDTGDWVKSSKSEYEYNDRGTLTLYVESYWKDDEWEIDYTTVFYYSMHTISGINDTKAEQVKIYSSVDAIVIENAALGEPVLVYSISGQLVQQTIVVSDETSIKLPKGVYIVRVGKTGVKIVK